MILLIDAEKTTDKIQEPLLVIMLWKQEWKKLPKFPKHVNS